jgi:hypothetical protein
MKEYKVEIEGVTPLLFNRFIEASIDSKTKKRVGSPKELIVEDKLYKTEEGEIYTPSTHIYGMLINASKNFKITGKGKATYSKLIGSSIEVSPDAIVHKIQKWRPFSISAVNPMTRGRMMVIRPMMEVWKLEFNLKFEEDDIPVEVIKNILDYGGQYVGIGDWRPATKGKYGKFIVTKFEELEG